MESEYADMQKRLEMSKDSLTAINQLQNEIKQKDWMISDLEQQCNRMDDTLKNVTLELESTQQECREACDAKEESEKTLSQTKLSLDTVTKSNRELEIKVKNLLEELSLTKGAVGDSSKEFAELKSKYTKL